jgi:phosphoesterase RecJ-like protein
MDNTTPEIADIGKIVSEAQTIVVVQADNPDADSLASALALEHLLGDMGKDVTLYCGVELPGYLKYLPGADRVVKELPTAFDASIIVDTSSDLLLEQLDKTGAKHWLAAKPSIVIDHHKTEATISFAKAYYNRPAVATAELIYEIANQLDWSISHEAKELITIGILSDSLGLTSEATSARTVYIIAELVQSGVSLAKLENARRSTQRRRSELIHYKGRLLQRVEFHFDERIATVAIPWEEIEKYSPLYNPPMLVLDDMRLALNTEVAIAFKLYPDGRITAKIRCNYGSAIADKLAEHFGGGGHPYASGFKILRGRSYEDIKSETIEVATKLLKENEQK